MMLLRYPQPIFFPDIRLDNLDASTRRVGAVHHPPLLYDPHAVVDWASSIGYGLQKQSFSTSTFYTSEFHSSPLITWKGKVKRLGTFSTAFGQSWELLVTSVLRYEQYINTGKYISNYFVRVTTSKKKKKKKKK